jgi:hypothetical protein
VLDHLTDAQKRAYIIADNQLALNAGWDEELLRIELAALQENPLEVVRVRGLSSRRVTRSLEGVIERRGKPEAIRCDNGPELTSRHFRQAPNGTSSPGLSDARPVG